MDAALRRRVRVLGELVGQVLVEARGPELLEDVERLRAAATRLRAEPGPRRLREIQDLVASFDLERAREVTRAFTLFFQLANLAEQRQRINTLREWGRYNDIVDASLAEAVETVRERDGEAALTELLARLEITPVLTAHPTESRRRAVVEGLQRVEVELERLDDPELTDAEAQQVRRRLLEEIATLWYTDPLRRERPTPLDEVRAALAYFDQTLFRVVPLVYRELDRALDRWEVGARPPAFPAFLRWGTWIGGDRDGNPGVTHETTRSALAIQAEHVLRGLENATRRIGRALTLSEDQAPPDLFFTESLLASEEMLPEQARALTRRAPEQPYRRMLLLCAERLAQTRTGGAAAYSSAREFQADLQVMQRALAGAGAARAAYGELQHLLWQLETFGFHLASLEIRQHSAVHDAALAELAPETSGDPALLDRLAREGGGDEASELSADTLEVLHTLRAMHELQQRWGEEACRRYVVSFTRSAADVMAVHALARVAVPDGSLRPEVVPLFESRIDLQAAPVILDELLALPGYSALLDERGRRLEVMLGYSDSAKDAGFLAANVALHRAQGRLAEWARRNEVVLTLFHGRGGALGRGGGPTNRAIRGQAPGSVAGRFKITEQGEVIFVRYGNIPIAARNLEQMTNAVMHVSTSAFEAEAAEADRRYGGLIGKMAAASEAAYRSLIETRGFPDFFDRVTAIEEIEQMRIGSRPPRRRGPRKLASLRAIPWVFAWTQNRCNLPGWYGLGAGLQAGISEAAVDTLREMYKTWPFFTSLLDNAEMSLAKTDWTIAEIYLRSGDRPDLAEAIGEELRRTTELVARVTENPEPLASQPFLAGSVELRNPYVDALSFLQLRFLRELRASADGGSRSQLQRLVMKTVEGIAAGLQNTG